MTTELQSMTATGLRDALGRGELTAVEVAESVLSHIGEREPVIRAWEFLDPDAVMDQARQVDLSRGRGPLHGIPVAVKDIMDTHDMPTGYGSPIYAGYRPRTDSAIVSRLHEAGAIVVGKTVTTEFAYFRPGPTVNPVDTRCTPGGSSSGSAAAVADRHVPVGFGSQTAGSLSRPASYCGLVGYKPSWGVHSLVGVKALAPSLDTLGWMARSVEDIELVRAVLLRIEPGAGDVPPVDRLRIGLCRTAEWGEAGDDTHEAVEGAARSLAAAGADVREVTLADEFATAVEMQKVVMAFEAAQSFAWEWTHHRDSLSEALQLLIEQGRACDPEEYVAAVRYAGERRVDIEKVFHEFDLLITPAAPGEAPEGLDATGDPVFTRMWTMLWLPSITLPIHTGSNGRPVGVQLVAGPLADEQLLRNARRVLGMLEHD